MQSPRTLYPQNRNKGIPCKRPIISPSPLSDIMQAMDQRPQKTSITVSTHIKERVCSRKRGNQTYDDVLNVLLDTVDTGEKGDEQGVVFLHTVYVKGELKKLKQPILLKMMIQEDNSYVLANEEFSFLISCSSIADGLEEGRRMFEEDYALYTNPENQVHPLAKKRAEMLQSAIWR